MNTTREELINKPIFILGSARSGTVFMGEILKRHLSIHCLIERPNVFRYASFSALNPDYKIERRQDLPGILRQTYQKSWKISGFNCVSCSNIWKSKKGLPWFSFRSCERRKEITRYADKSHQHLHNLGLPQEAFPETHFIYLQRDDSDVVSSMLRHSGVLSWLSEQSINENSYFPQPWFGVQSFDHYQDWKNWPLAMNCALRWSSWTRIGKDWSDLFPSSKWLTVRYEDLVSEPVKLGKQIFSYLGLPYLPSTGRNAFGSSVRHWKDKLTKVQLKQVIRVAGETLLDIGYGE